MTVPKPKSSLPLSTRFFPVRLIHRKPSIVDPFVHVRCSFVPSPLRSNHTGQSDPVVRIPSPFKSSTNGSQPPLGHHQPSTWPIPVPLHMPSAQGSGGGCGLSEFSVQ